MQKHNKAVGKMLLVSLYKKVLTSFLFFISLFIITFSCDSTEPPPPDETKPTLTLAIDDASCTEAWLQLTTKDLTLPAELTLKQYNPEGDSVTQTFSLSTPDSLLFIDSLLPNQTYQYQVSSIQHQVSSIKQPVTTMDTTSHNFTFQSWTFGTIGSSTLYDVAIINENNIWAVGEIMIADTSINGYTVYNAVHWDGSEWELHKFYFYTVSGQPDTGVYEARSILAFDANNVWITCGSQITKWNGVRQINRQWTSVYANKLWGSNNNNIYAVGINGQIAHYNGTSWQRIESGTTLIIGDIWGIKDFNKKYLAADNSMLIVDSINQVHRIESNGQSLSSIWGTNERLLYAAGGSGLLKYKNYNWEKVLEQGTIRIVRGSEYNDVYGLGNSIIGEITHFNGYTWTSINIGTFYTHYGLSVKQNIIAAAGWNGDKALITIGQR
jgi:hypothetical protein